MDYLFKTSRCTRERVVRIWYGDTESIYSISPKKVYSKLKLRLLKPPLERSTDLGQQGGRSIVRAALEATS